MDPGWRSIFHWTWWFSMIFHWYVSLPGRVGSLRGKVPLMFQGIISSHFCFHEMLSPSCEVCLPCHQRLFGNNSQQWHDGSVQRYLRGLLGWMDPMDRKLPGDQVIQAVTFFGDGENVTFETLLVTSNQQPEMCFSVEIFLTDSIPWDSSPWKTTVWENMFGTFPKHLKQI